MPLVVAAYLGIADAAAGEAQLAVAGRREPHVIQTMGELLRAHRVATDLVAAMFADADDLRFDGSDDRSSRILARKAVASDALLDTVRLAIEATGGRGFSRTSPLERLYRDVHGVLFHPLPRAKQTIFSGRIGLGLDPIG